MKKPKYSIQLKDVVPGMLFTYDSGDFSLVLSASDYYITPGDFFDKNKIKEIGFCLVNLCLYERITSITKGNIHVLMQIVSSKYAPTYVLYSNSDPKLI